MFSDTLCVLQDRFTRILIGTGEERDGVYVYRDVQFGEVSELREQRTRLCGIVDWGIHLLVF